MKVETHQCLNSFHHCALKAGSSMGSPHPKMNKRGISTKHVSNQLSWLCTYTKSSRQLRLWAVLKLEWVVIPQAPHSSFAEPKSRSCGGPMLCLQVRALRAADRLCLPKKPYSESFASMLRATSPSTPTECKRANHGRKWGLNTHGQIS